MKGARKRRANDAPRAETLFGTTARRAPSAAGEVRAVNTMMWLFVPSHEGMRLEDARGQLRESSGPRTEWARAWTRRSARGVDRGVRARVHRGSEGDDAARGEKLCAQKPAARGRSVAPVGHAFSDFGSASARLPEYLAAAADAAILFGAPPPSPPRGPRCPPGSTPGCGSPRLMA